MRPTRPLFLSPCLGATILITMTGCASRSGGPGSPVPTQLELEPYNGTWIVERSDSDAPGVRLGVPLQRIGGPSEAAKIELLAALVEYPRVLTLEISDSIFALTADSPDQSLTLPMDGSRSQIRSEGGRSRTYGSITWNDGAPTIERQFPENGWISDHFQLTGGRLVITRTSGFGEWEGRGSLRLVYLRDAGTEGSTGHRR